MAYTASFAKHLMPGFRDVVGTTFKTVPVIYSRILHVETTNRAYEEYLAATGLPPAVAKPEGEPIKFFDPLEGETLRITPSAKAMGVQVSREAWDDDLYKSKSAIRKAAKSLTQSYVTAVEIDSADMLNNGFTSYGTIDGADSLFNTDHPRIDGGGSQANRPATDMAFSVTALRQAILQFKKWTDDRGNKIMAQPVYLVHPPDLTFRIREILGASGEPDSNSNNPNVVKGILQPIEWRYLTSPTAWFILGRNHYLYFLWRTRPVLDAYDDRNTKVAKFTIWGRYGLGAVHWHEAWGTTGA